MATNRLNLDPLPSLDYAIDITDPKIKANGDIDYGGMTFLRNNNPNGIAPELKRDSDGAFLRLTVERDAYTQATEGEPDMRDRCELRDGKLRLGTSVWYSFEMRAEPSIPKVDARLVCAQIKAPYYDANGGSPLFALRIDHGRFVATVEHLYEAKDAPTVNGHEKSKYLIAYKGGRRFDNCARAFDHHVFGNSPKDFKELQVRALFATDSRGLPAHLEAEFQSCTKGVIIEQRKPLPRNIYKWWRFRIEVAPTKKKDYAGIVQLFVTDPSKKTDTLAATAKGEFGHTGYENPTINTGPPEDQSYQYFKIGPYRDKVHLWGCREAALHVRNIRRGSWAFGEDFQREELKI